MRDERLSVADRAHLLVAAHHDWIEDYARAVLADHDCDVEGDTPISFDALVDNVTYIYLEAVDSPILEVNLLADEQDPEGNFYTDAFANSVSVAVEKLLG